jgi:hypothetical protein
VLTGAALGVTAYGRALGKQLEAADGEPVEGGTDPSSVTSPDIAKVQRRLKLCQWAVPRTRGGTAAARARRTPAGRRSAASGPAIGPGLPAVPPCWRPPERQRLSRRADRALGGHGARYSFVNQVAKSGRTASGRPSGPTSVPVSNRNPEKPDHFSSVCGPTAPDSSRR